MVHCNRYTCTQAFSIITGNVFIPCSINHLLPGPQKNIFQLEKEEKQKGH